MKIKWWLREYLESISKEESVFLAAYDPLSPTDTKYIRNLLEKDTANRGTKSIPIEINRKIQDRTLIKIAQALSSDLDVRPCHTSSEVQEIRKFHANWQKRQRTDTAPHVKYHSQIVAIIERLNELEYPLSHRLNSTETPCSNPAKSYADQLSSLLLSPLANSAELIGELEQLLEEAQLKHIQYIAHLAEIMAYHFVPKALSNKINGNGITIGSDEPAPAIYRLIQNWRNDVLSGNCEYDTRTGTIRGAIPINREVVESSEFIDAIASRIHKRIDSTVLASADEDSYEDRKHTKRAMSSLNTRLDMQSKSPSSPFVYGLTPQVFDSNIATKLSTELPSLKYYEYEIEADEDILEFIDLDSFLKEAGWRIDQRKQLFETQDPAMAAMLKLVAKALETNGNKAQLPSKPKSNKVTDSIKWMNDVIKLEKGVSEFLKKYPDVLDGAGSYISTAKGIVLENYEALHQVISNISK